MLLYAHTQTYIISRTLNEYIPRIRQVLAQAESTLRQSDPRYRLELRRDLNSNLSVIITTPAPEITDRLWAMVNKRLTELKESADHNRPHHRNPKIKRGDKKAAILRLLQDHPDQLYTLSDIAEHVNGSIHYVYTLMKAFERDHKVKMTTLIGQNGRPISAYQWHAS